jgi:outer membrane protein
MKRLVTSLAVVTALACASTVFADEGMKIASVDFRKIVQESEKGKKGTEEMKEMAGQYQTKLNAKRKQLEKMKADLDKNGAKLTDAKRNAKVKELQKKIAEFQEFGQNAEQEMAKKEKDLSTQVGTELENVIREYGRANGYTAILHKEGIIYNNGNLIVKDLSEDILKSFNSAPKETTPKKQP